MDARLEDRLFRSVLVVDPYPTGRGAVSAALAELGYSVVAVATAAEGRPIAEGGAIDMIVADADVAAIRSLILDLQASGRSIPTVLLTTQGLFARRVPNTTMLQKPTGLDALSSALTGSLPG